MTNRSTLILIVSVLVALSVFLGLSFFPPPEGGSIFPDAIPSGPATWFIVISCALLAVAVRVGFWVFPPLRDIFRIPELRRRILTTLGLLAIFRVGFWIYLPGIDIDVHRSLLEAGKGLRFAVLPEGQDPDDLIRAEGAGAMGRVVEDAQPMVRLLWRRETEGRVFDSPERRAALDQSLRAALMRIRDPLLRRHWGEALRDLRAELFGTARAAFETRGEGRGEGGGAGQGGFSGGPGGRGILPGASQKWRAAALRLPEVASSGSANLRTHLPIRTTTFHTKLRFAVETPTPQAAFATGA